MDRKEFLSLIGASSVSFGLACIGCSKSSSGKSIAGPTGVDFTIDISQPPNTPLQTNSGYIYNSGVIVARTTSGTFLAVQQSCTHESVSVTYQGTQHRFFCNGHSGIFSETGAVMGGPPSVALTKYNTSLNGNMLRVYS